MKKILLFAMSVVLVFTSLSICSSASTTDGFLGGGTYTIQWSFNETSSIQVNMLKNPYYRIYGDKILEYNYEHFIELYGDNEANSRDALAEILSKLPAGENYVSYGYYTLYFEKPQSIDNYNNEVHDYNMDILMNCMGRDRIIYAGENTYCAVVELSKYEADAIKKENRIICFSDAFVTMYPDITVDCVVGERTMGDVISTAISVSERSDDDIASPSVFERKVNATDARAVLRYSAGLFEPTQDEAKQFFFCGDINFDCELNSTDARLILRLSAGIDDPVQMMTFAYDAYWYDLDLISVSD